MPLCLCVQLKTYQLVFLQLSNKRWGKVTKKVGTAKRFCHFLCIKKVCGFSFFVTFMTISFVVWVAQFFYSGSNSHVDRTEWQFYFLAYCWTFWILFASWYESHRLLLVEFAHRIQSAWCLEQARTGTQKRLSTAPGEVAPLTNPRWAWLVHVHRECWCHRDFV